MASCSPAAPDSEGVASSRLPSWILLDLVGYIDDDGEHGNSTTAEARTSSWQSEGVRVSFFAADPPRLSHFSIHVPCRTKKPLGRPSILQSVDNLALIDVTFACGYRAETEYYVYRAGVRGQRPSLEHLGYVSCQLKDVPGVASVGILPNDGDCGFALVAIAFTPVAGQYGLHVYRAEGGTWTSKVHLFEGHQLANIHLSNIEKVIALGGGEIGFVDLWKGILAFNILQEKPMPRFVPLPTLLPGNQFDSQLGCSARLFRDVILSTDGSIKCVEIEACWRRILHERPQQLFSDESPQDLWHNDVLHDSDLMPHHTADKEDETKEAKETYEYLGWRVIAWSRDLSSTCWHKNCFFHAEDIVTNPIHTTLSCELQLRGSSSHTLTLKDLFVSFPTLSMDGSILYIMCKVKMSDQECLVFTVDTRSNSLEEFSQIITKQPYLFKPIACDLFKYLNSDSDGTQIGEDYASHLASSALEPTEESGGIKLIRPSNQYIRLEDFSRSIIPTWTVPFSCNYQLQPHQSLPLSVTQIGGEDASWWTSSISRATEENFNKWHGQQQHPPAVPHRCQQSPPPREIEEVGDKINDTVEPSDNS